MNGGAPGEVDVFATAYVGCAAFAALLPLRAGRAIPGIIRAAFAVALTPLASIHIRAAISAPNSTAGDTPYAALLLIAAAGASTGLVATAVTSAAESAGALIDQVLCGSAGLSGEQAGPMSLLLAMGVGIALCQSGALALLMLAVAATPHVHPQHVTSMLDAMRVGTVTVVSIALPALCAHGVAAIVAALVARIAPRINGLLFAPALSTPLVLTVTMIGAGSLVAWLRQLSTLAVEIAQR